MSDTWDAEDRAIARALDAAPDAETQGADEELVATYRDVLGQLPEPDVTRAAELEERIVAAALERRPAAAPTLDRVRARRHRRVRVGVLATATAAAAVVVGLIVSTTGSTSAPGGHVTLATVQRADVDAIVRAPGTRTGNFGGAFGRVAIARNGNAAIFDLTTPDPGLLGIRLASRGGTTSIGPAQPVGGAIAFVVDHPERVTAVALLRNGVVVARAELRTS